MKVLKESRGIKWVVILLVMVSIMALPLGMLGVYYTERTMLGGNFSDAFAGVNYWKTWGFQEEVSRKMGQLSEYLQLKSILESNGVLDYNKTAVVVLDEDGKETKYTIGELIKRNKFFVENVMPVNDENLSLLNDLFHGARPYYEVGRDRRGNHSSIEHWLNMIRDQAVMEELHVFENLEAAQNYYGRVYLAKYLKGEKKEVLPDEAELNTAETVVTEEMNTTAYERILLMREAGYLPEQISQRLEKEYPMYDQGTLQDIVDAIYYEGYGSYGEWLSEDTAYTEILEEPIQMEGPMMKAYLLDEMAYDMTYYVAYYLYYQELFREGNTNFLYWISCGNRTESNLSTEQRGDSLESAFQVPVLGDIHYSTENYTMVSDWNARDLRSYMDEIEMQMQENENQNCRMHVAVAYQSGVNDVFASGMHQFEMGKRLAIGLTAGLVGAALVLLLGTWYLIAAAGHKKNVEGISLIWFDRWYTEIAAGIIVMLELAAAAMILEWNYFYGGLSLWDGIPMCLMMFFGCLVGMFGMASLVRRIKAKTLWRGSICYKLFSRMAAGQRRLTQKLRELYDNGSVAVKLGGVYAGACAITALLCLLCAASGDGAVFLLSALIVFVLYLLLFWQRFREAMRCGEIVNGAERIAEGDLNYKMEVAHVRGDLRRMAVAVNRIGDGLSVAIEQSLRNERMKTDLITNVSHDIKTPLTSIINYVELLKREHIEDEKIASYIEVLENKSQRLKNLTDDLVEASKLSSGNVVLTVERLNLVELVNQTNGEFAEKFALKDLTMVTALPSYPVMIEADGRRVWRILENLYHNVAKYAMEHTRVYASITEQEGMVSFVLKNISEHALNIDANELTERFIRGDVSRSTEGSGLGLSIAKSLTELMKGTFEIYLDGDLFRVTISFPVK